MAGEAVLGAFLSVLLDKLANRDLLNYFGRLMSVNQKKLEQWRTTLIEIEEVLNDAEEKQLTKPSVKSWLDDLKDLAYDVEDILDEFSTDMLRVYIKEKYGSITSMLKRPFYKAKFNFNMNSAIKEVDDRLQEISKRKDTFGFSKTRSSSAKQWKIPPSSSRPAKPVIGREKDKETVLKFLCLEGPSSSINFHVAAIIGLGGVGKTTLVGDVFNDAATQEFNPKAWVSVSDDFNIERLTKEILQYFTFRQCSTESFSKAQEELAKTLRGKKFLIVLDDVWVKPEYDLHDLWTRLQSAFNVGAPGSMILLTSRDINVAKIMGASDVHRLECVSDDHCMQIFEQHAFGNNINISRPPNYELIQKKVVSKCGGLPLAARSLGGVLCRESAERWEDILNNELWSLFASYNSHILPVLQLSYHYLPSNLKRCFAYCSILPYDYEFGENQLILLWMAEGFIQQRPEDRKQMEEMGSDYFQELLSRSLFQKSPTGNTRYIMHDLVTDLARWAAGETCFVLEDKLNDESQLKCVQKARHSSYIRGEYDGVKKFEPYSRVGRLRTFLPLKLSESFCLLGRHLASKVTFELLPKFSYLRVLSLNGYQIVEFPDSIGEWKHLRYLDLSFTAIRSLPDSTTNLCNLQTLLLEGCYRLKALPTNMRNLISLRHLNNSGVSLLEEMPPHLGQLTNLQTLPSFVVGKGSGTGLREIGPLLNLQGRLRLSRLENVTDAEDARSASLKNKERLEELLLEWSSNSSVSKELSASVLDMLQPFKKLKELTIKGYAGFKFSTWIGDPSFSNMVIVRLEGCKLCQFLPPVGQLPSLKELHIKSMPAVESVGPEFYGKGNSPFQALETLVFVDMENWQEWLPCQQDQGIEVFACLQKLSISRCHKLKGRLPGKVESLAKLEIFRCEELVVSLSDDYRKLQELDIRKCKGLEYESAVHFELLESLCLSEISEFKLQTEEFGKGLSKVKGLEINGCEELTSSSQNKGKLLHYLVSLGRFEMEDNSTLVEELGKEAEELQLVASKLEYLTLRKCGSLLKVPNGFHHMTYLQELEIYECSNLVCFEETSLPTSLKVIKIEGCNSLVHFTKYQIPQSLRRIVIWNCEKLKSLIEKEEDVVQVDCSSSHCLEYLSIGQCPSLIHLLCKGQLPKSLKNLYIWDCGQLESISDSWSQLEEFYINSCPNIKVLPGGMCNLTNLKSFTANRCESLVSLPRYIQDMNNNLQKLEIDYCEGLTSTFFPPNLTTLTLWKMTKMGSCKELLESDRLTFLKELAISGDDPDLVAFPPNKNKRKEMPILKTLTFLIILDFPNLKKLSNDIQLLTSLEHLWIHRCPKFACMPEEGLPRSLQKLSIQDCPIFEEKLKAGSKGRYWPRISHIPCIRIHLDPVI